MERSRVRAALELAAWGALLLVFHSAMAQEQSPKTPSGRGGSPPAQAAIACRTLEVKTVERMGVTLLMFHQANQSDGPRLGELLKQNDGLSVELETPTGPTHTATLFRLGTCFGRGLLVFPAGSVHLTAGEQFGLRFPQGRKSGREP